MRHNDPGLIIDKNHGTPKTYQTGALPNANMTCEHGTGGNVISNYLLSYFTKTSSRTHFAFITADVKFLVCHGFCRLLNPDRCAAFFVLGRPDGNKTFHGEIFNRTRYGISCSDATYKLGKCVAISIKLKHGSTTV